MYKFYSDFFAYLSIRSCLFLIFWRVASLEKPDFQYPSHCWSGWSQTKIFYEIIKVYKIYLQARGIASRKKSHIVRPFSEQKEPILRQPEIAYF